MKVSKSISIEAEILNKLDKLAKAENLSINAFIENWIERLYSHKENFEELLKYEINK